MKNKSTIFILGLIFISSIFYLLSNKIQLTTKDNTYIFLDKLNECSKNKTCSKEVLEEDLNDFLSLLEQNFFPLTNQDKKNFNTLISENMKEINLIFNNLEDSLSKSNYPIIILYLSRYYNSNIEYFIKDFYKETSINLYKEAANNITFLFLQEQLFEYISKGREVDFKDYDFNALESYYFLIKAKDESSIINKVKFVNECIELMERNFQINQNSYYNRLYRLVIHSKLPESFVNNEYKQSDIEFFNEKFKDKGYLDIYPNRKKKIDEEVMTIIERITSDK